MEVILCRLGNSFVPHYIQKKWFEYNNIKNMFPICYKTVEATPEELLSYKHRNKYDHSYLHHYKELNADDNKVYKYCTEDELKFLNDNEKKISFETKNIQLHKQFFNNIHYSLWITDENRTDALIIKLVKEYCKECAGQEDIIYGNHLMKVVEIPDDIDWYVEQPEGANEFIYERCRIWGMNGLIKS